MRKVICSPGPLRFPRAGLWPCLLVLVGAAAVPAQANINGFGDGTNYQLNSSPAQATVMAGVFQPTDGNNGESASLFYDTKQSITNFAADFTYQDLSGGADGIAFVLQNQGLTALGGGGGQLGYAGINPSAAVAFSIYSGPGTQFVSGGANPQDGTYASVSPVSLGSGDKIDVALTYNGSTLSESLTDQTTLDTFFTSFAANLPTLVGGNTAYVGFTGATGSLNSTQQISNFTYNPVPEPAFFQMASLLGMGGLGFWKRRRQLA